MKKLSVSQIADETNLAQTATYQFTTDFHKLEAIQIAYTSTTSSFSITVETSLDASTWTAVQSAKVSNNDNGSVYISTAAYDALYWRVNVVRTSGTLLTLKVFKASSPRT